MKRIYLMQHGQAVDKGHDPARPLSEAGRAEVRAMAAWLSAIGHGITEVRHSGKLRAEQSAGLMIEGLGGGLVAEVMQGIAPNDPLDRLRSALEGLVGGLLVVGHQPFMGRMAASLLSARQDGLAVAFEPGSVVCLEQIDPVWHLRCMMRPDCLAG